MRLAKSHGGGHSGGQRRASAAKEGVRSVGALVETRDPIVPVTLRAVSGD